MDESPAGGPTDSANPKLSSNVQYGILGKGWHSGSLVLENENVSLQSDAGQAIFSVPVSDISKVSARNAIGFGIYLNGDKKRYTIKFASPFAGAVPLAIGAY